MNKMKTCLCKRRERYNNEKSYLGDYENSYITQMTFK